MKNGPWLFSSGSERHVLQHRCQPTPTQPIYMLCTGGGVREQGSSFYRSTGSKFILVLEIAFFPSTFRVDCRLLNVFGRTKFASVGRSVGRYRSACVTRFTLRPPYEVASRRSSDDVLRCVVLRLVLLCCGVMSVCGLGA